ncbi:MAG TPA: GGDEF domain-containing protein [Geobacteraceae bacterium]|nr:GGDEF domain-containing protein [Geobacteraceae bacterium]
MSNIRELMAGKIRLPSPPAIAIKILDMVRRDDFSFKDLAQIIESDPALVAKILRVANSPYYNFNRRVDNIDMALSVLGTHAVKNIALSFVICSDMKASEESGFDFDLFWRRAITAAVAAELTASLVGVKSQDTFVTALLQDIGIIVLFSSCPEEYQLVMKENVASKATLHEVEKHCFGFDHQELGAELLSQWHIPESIYIPIKYHHQDNSIPNEYRTQTEIIRLADNLSSIYHGGQSVDKVLKVRERLKTVFGVGEEAVEELIDAVASKSIDILATFEIPPGAMQPFTMILQEANEELSKLNTSYEMLVIELRQAKVKAEKLADELHNANVKLHELVFCDALTGLYNHRFFQEAMEREFERSKRYKRDLSLIMFDIDHFKKVNDTYGHLVGDRVLIGISRATERSVRDSDIIARYGGEEFAVILPETDFNSAKVVAERLRSDIENLEAVMDGIKIRVTISVGYSSYNFSSTLRDKGAIIGMADKALYIAKQSGRNMVYAMKLPGS